MKEYGISREKQKNNTSGYKGVTYRKSRNCWEARIMLNGKTVYTGCFDNKEEAALAYNKVAIKYHGEFAKINIIQR